MTGLGLYSDTRIGAEAALQANEVEEGGRPIQTIT
jgi:hypothetical protein